MKKADREKVFNKYGGRCAYCGDPLQKGWHVDEIKPVRRNRKYVQAHWRDKVTKKEATFFDLKGMTEAEVHEKHEWYKGGWKADGAMHPERFHIDNQNPACASCNINKHSGSLEDFRELIQGFMKHLNGVNTQYKIAKRYGLVKEEIKPVVFYFERVEMEKISINK
jgi:5-methylcytosine-specific restriction endonuclease McrA